MNTLSMIICTTTVLLGPLNGYLFHHLDNYCASCTFFNVPEVIFLQAYTLLYLFFTLMRNSGFFSKYRIFQKTIFQKLQ